MATQQKKKNGTAPAGTAMKNISPLEKFFIHQLQDIYYVEQTLKKELKEMKTASTSEELEEAFDRHLQQTEKHIIRLEKVFEMIGQKPQGKKCEAMDGLIKESKSILKETEEGTATRDAALIISAQKVEHYEIATYGSLLQLALTMDLHRAAKLLDKTLQEEGETDHNLTFLAESFINLRAEQEEPYSWQKQDKKEALELSV